MFIYKGQVLSATSRVREGKERWRVRVRVRVPARACRQIKGEVFAGEVCLRERERGKGVG